MKAEKNNKLEASNTRKQEMQKLEIQRKRNEKPSDLEQVGSSTVSLLKRERTSSILRLLLWCKSSKMLASCPGCLAPTWPGYEAKKTWMNSRKQSPHQVCN